MVLTGWGDFWHPVLMISSLLPIGEFVRSHVGVASALAETSGLRNC
jgi:hypothetical protein